MSFFTTAVSTMSTLVVALGGGVGVWGVVNLMEGYGADILTGAGRVLAAHKLADEFLLVLDQPPVIGVKGSLRHILKDFDTLKLVALAQNAPLTLFDVRRPPGAVQMVKRRKPCLDVCASPHLGGGA